MAISAIYFCLEAEVSNQEIMGGYTKNPSLNIDNMWCSRFHSKGHTACELVTHKTANESNLIASKYNLCGEVKVAVSMVLLIYKDNSGGKVNKSTL